MNGEARPRTLLWILVGGGAFFLFVLAVFTLVYLALRSDREGPYVTTGSGGKIAVVDIGVDYDFAQVEGLIHASEIEMAGVQAVKDVLREGQPVQVRILHVDAARQRMGLSLRN